MNKVTKEKIKVEFLDLSKQRWEPIGGEDMKCIGEQALADKFLNGINDYPNKSVEAEDE